MSHRLGVLAWAMLSVLASLPVPGASGAAGEPVTGSCEGAACAWAVPGAPFPALLFAPGVDEVQPRAWRAENLTLAVEDAARGGTIYFSTGRVPLEAEAGALSVWLRSSGDLDRFPLLVREFSGDTVADSVFFVPAAPEWTFVSFAWSAKLPGATHVGIALRGELRAGASANVSFTTPYFGPDTTRWYLDGAAEPFAIGPQAGHRFAAPGSYAVRAVTPSGATHDFRIDGPRVEARPVLEVLPSPRLPGGVRVLAQTVEHGFHPELARGGDFASPRAAWPLMPHERGLVSRAMPEDGALRVDVGAQDRESAAWISQRVAWTPGVEHEILWRAHDDRGLLRYEHVVLESDGTRHVLSAAPGGEWGRAGEFRFVPGTTEGEIQLRAVFAAGVSGTVWFDHVSLRRSFSYEWHFDGRRVVSDGPLVDLVVNRSSPHDLSVRLVDFAGTPSMTRRTLEAGLDLGEPPLALRGDPRASLVGQTLVLDTSPTWDGPFDVLATAAPWTGWRLEDAEAPGEFRIVHEGALARVEAGPMTTTAGGGIERVISTPSGDHAHHLIFHYRTVGGVERVQALARYLVPGVEGGVEHRANYSASPEARAGVLRVPAAPSNHTLLLLGLRAIVAENETGSLELLDATLTPAFVYEWTGAAGSGPVAALRKATPGLADWSLVARSPGGLVLWANGTVGFSPAVRPYATLDNGVVASWNATHFPDGVTLRIVGPAAAQALASAGEVRTRTFSPGNYTVVATSPGGQSLELGHREMRDRTSLSADAQWNGSRRAPLEFAFELPNPEIRAARVHVESGGRSEVVALAPANDTWRGTWRPDLSWPPGDFAVTLELEDQDSSLRVPVGVVHLAVTTGEPESSWLPLAILAIAAVAAWMPRERRTLRSLAAPSVALGTAELAALALAALLGSLAAPAGAPSDVALVAGSIWIGFALAARAALRAWRPIPPAAPPRHAIEAALVAVPAALAALVLTTILHQTGTFSGVPRRIFVAFALAGTALVLSARLALDRLRRRA